MGAILERFDINIHLFNLLDFLDFENGVFFYNFDTPGSHSLISVEIQSSISTSGRGTYPKIMLAFQKFLYFITIDPNFTSSCGLL